MWRRWASSRVWTRPASIDSPGTGERPPSSTRALALERTAARVFVISDFMSCQPVDLLAHASTRRTLDLVRILAPHELGDARAGRTEWFDPEDGARLDVDVDAATRARYELELGRELERWRQATAASRVAHHVHSSLSPFEDIACRSWER